MSSSTPGLAERRFLSILFCAMVDSSGHQFRMDPEQFEALLTAYRHTAYEQIRRHGGHVARVIGDGILATFGWPRAGGRDAQAAVRCALEIGARLDRMNRRPTTDTAVDIAARMAIETGWVLVGEIGPAHQVEHDGVIGPAPNVAARLQRLARRNGVVVGEGTLPLLRGHFLIESADTTGIELPMAVAAAHVLGLADSEDPLARLRAGRRTPLIGRDAELGILRTHWANAAAGRGQVVMLSGEPGIGKSRLIGDLLDDLPPDSHSAIALYCAEHMADSSFHPLAEPLMRGLGLSPDASDADIQAASRDFAERAGLARQQAGAAISVLLGAGPAIEGPSRSELRRWTFDALRAWLVRLAAERPVVLLTEDLHWSDASLAEFLRHMAEQAAELPLLIIATYRPDHVPAWPERPHIHRMQLGRLPAKSSHELAESIVGNIDASLGAALVDRAEGVPLFIEEFARTVADQAGISNRLPGSVSQLLAARLDSLGPARGLAQLASVIGREASASLLAPLSDLTAEDFAEQSDRLVDSGVMSRRGVGERAVLQFRHALLADAAYQALTASRRRLLHGRVAERLRGDPYLAATLEPEILGRHLELSGAPAEAALQFRRAAENALVGGAFVEAEAHAKRAIRLAEDMAAAERTRAVLSSTVVLGEALIATLGYANERVLATFEQATKLALDMADAHELLPVLRGLTAFYQVRGPLHRAQEVGARMLQLARLDGDELLIAEAERRQGWCQLCRGELAEARTLLEAAVARFFNADPARSALAAVDTAVMGLANLGWLAWFTEGDAAALRRAEQATARAEVSAKPLAITYGLGIGAVAHQLAGDAEGARSLAVRTEEIARARGIVYWAALSQVLRGWAEAVDGGNPEGLALLRSGIAEYSSTRGEILKPYALGLLAEAERAVGSASAAIAALDQAEATARAIGAAMYLSWLDWIRGRVLDAIGDRQAREVLERARTTALGHGAGALAARIEKAQRSVGSGQRRDRSTPARPGGTT